MLHVLRQLASRQSIHCGPDQGRGVVRRGGCSSGGGLTGFAGVAWISMGRLSRSSPKSLSLSFSFFSFTNAFASCSSIGGRTSVVSCRCRVFCRSRRHLWYCAVCVAVHCVCAIFAGLPSSPLFASLSFRGSNARSSNSHGRTHCHRMTLLDVVARHQQY